jgi:predicted lipoprotein with Yx(FWY)xxD motif
MKRIHILGGVLAAAVLAGGGAAVDVALSGPGTPPAAAATPAGGAPAAAAPAGLGTADLPPGSALVDGAGRTLYLFEADTGTVSTCDGACAQVWPPLLTPGGAPSATGAVQGALVATSARTDGSTQVTYHGHPLYYFAGDKAPGDAEGQDIHNFGGGWYVVTPAGDKIDPDDPAPAAAPVAPAAPAPAASTGTGYGY